MGGASTSARPFGDGSVLPLVWRAESTACSERTLFLREGSRRIWGGIGFCWGPCPRDWVKAFPSGRPEPLTTSEESRAVIAFRPEWPFRPFDSVVTSMALGGTVQDRGRDRRTCGAWSADFGGGKVGRWPWEEDAHRVGSFEAYKRMGAPGVVSLEPTVVSSRRGGVCAGDWLFFRGGGLAAAAFSRHGLPDVRRIGSWRRIIRAIPNGTVENGGPPGRMGKRFPHGPSRPASNGPEHGPDGGGIGGGLPCLPWGCRMAGPW